ncbi:bifunctional metallophosphatase/5'-nucleotidase [Alginatibacterium sediminis]|uniref:Bifunctional metallophosphatase/5'-nucleotidase n=1 Tax=Alginatibacterium sediminis TaxID=2164068 RepID=A0A420EGV6_9ALTE|nr:5'-nucleotidase C-terminal domain-containing protein [Alginatibacterium sediminis]RKF19913.1 bifunctional metallophosphatase/5'-nucleotidase [Alginatibacterium sediminis]
MKLTYLLFACCMTLPSLNAVAAKLQIVFTSNIPNIIDDDDKVGITQLAGFYENLEKRNPQGVLFLHGGDSLFPNALSNYDQGAHMIDVLNHLPISLMFANQSEFSLGVDNLSLRAYEASFPLILSNIVDTRTWDSIEGIQPSYILSANNIDVGVFSLVDSSITSNYVIPNVTLLDLQNSIDDSAESLKEQGADFIVLMSEEDLLVKLEGVDLSEIDLLLLANSGEDYVDLNAKPVRVKSGGQDGEVALISIDTQHNIEATIQSYASSQSSLQLELVIQAYVNRIDSFLSQYLYTTTQEISTKREDSRVKETVFGNLVADAIRAYLSADIAIVNSGSIRGERIYPKGSQISRLDIRQELPFGSAVYAIELTPQELKKVLEHSLSGLPQAKGQFLQVSGINIEYDSQLPAGKRIISLKRNGQALTQNTYSLAVSEYLLKGGDGYAMIANKKPMSNQHYSRLTWEIVSEYLLANENLVSADIGKRLIDLSQ